MKKLSESTNEKGLVKSCNLKRGEGPKTERGEVRQSAGMVQMSVTQKDFFDTCEVFPPEEGIPDNGEPVAGIEEIISALRFDKS